ncbi:MAG: class II D-tagatose-bisphosphate aldolase, non-catalytic subunit [Lachnospiraceae bacterium]|nr:class II D-tagatose-bisphosphate aldolase, non-catalytic subunit [Lachnospiraceae bacterium]
MKHPLQEMMKKRKEGIKCGIPSYCSANELVIEAVLERAKETNVPALIEATANQVNQYGGYTGMKPQDFMDNVLRIAEKIGCKKELIILAGDHLGPLTWKDEPEASAMEKSKELVREYVLAGFTKIHLDTSMKLGNDELNQPLATKTIATRGVILYQTCMEAYQELLARNKDALRPVFIIGSEVPIPGGAQEAEEGISVTRPEDFEETVNTYKSVFREYGCEDAWKDIIAVVVQPGVEFGDAQVFMYDRDNARELCEKLKEYPEIVFEGHSTDYQSPECLKKMVEDGIAILKVGPALTFGLREALFGLSMIEKEIIPITKRSNFIEVLDEVMIEKPDNWKKHYHGNEKAQAFARKYSFSDRCRYYIGDTTVEDAIEKLFRNLTETEIPLNILQQYLPIQYNKIRDKKLSLNPREIAKAGVINYLEDYEYAVNTTA